MTKKGYDAAKAIKFAGHFFDMHPSGVLFWREYKVMIVSDLHLEKNSRFALNSGFIQSLDTTETLTRLKDEAERLRPDKIILLGDIFHDPDSFSRMSLDNIDRLYEFLKSRHVVWIEGQHNGGFSPPDVDMRIEYAFLNINFRHIASDYEDFEISGYYHPCVTIHYKNERVRRRCFVCDKTRLIMPSFGTINAGIDVTDPAIQSLFQRQVKIYPIGPQKVYGLNPERIAS